MRKPGTIIPDSEDDAVYSGTSLKNSSPLHHQDSLQWGGSSLSRSRSTNVIPDSEDEGDDSLNVPSPVSTRTRNRVSVNVEVVIPVNKDESPSDSSRSSLGGPSADGTTGFNTPATSVGVATESDIKKPRTRVNASERASRLRSNTMSRSTSERGTKRSAAAFSADEVDSENADAALAYALQVEEYEQPAPKKRKTLFNSARGPGKQGLNDQLDSDVSESELSDRLTPLSPLSPELEFFNITDDSEATEDEDLAVVERRGSQRRQAFFNRLANYADEDEDDSLLTWEEQRKLRRVSLCQSQHTEGSLTISFQKQADRKKLESKHPIITTMWDDLKARPIITPKEAKQPGSITRQLKPFQLEGLNWMMEQEKTDYKGGLLGDEMGMGKTIQAVSLIMSDFPQRHPTLVIVPPVALMQWESEIKV